MRFQAALIALVCLATVLVPGQAAFAQTPAIGGCSIYLADDVWNTPIDTLPLDANSSTYVSTIGAGKGLKADFGSGLWDDAPIGIPYTTVTGSATKYSVAFDIDDQSDPGPYAVPLNAPIEGNGSGDAHAIAIDTTNCIDYELYAASPQASSWDAGSGAIFNLKSYALRPSTWTSADAAGLPIFPGLVRYDEIAGGEIDHAIRFTVPQTRNTFIWPARHQASDLTDTKYPQMGQRFRLKASFDISGFSPTNQIILKALKKYGMIVADNGSSWYMSGAPDERWDNDDLHDLGTILGSQFEAVDESSLMIDPNSSQAKQASGGGTTVSVSVTPSAASVPVGTTKQFSATVSGSTNHAVTWQVNGVASGNSMVGTITTAGLYKAPAKVPSGSVAVQAKSAANGSVVGSASITVTSPPAVKVTISPTNVSVRTGHTQQFSATVSNATNKAVVWKVNGVTGGNSTVGTISTSGIYRAPMKVPSNANVTVSATSVQSSAASASTTVTIKR